MDVAAEFLELVNGQLKATGKDLQRSASVIAGYAAARAEHLSKIPSTAPGYAEAVAAEAKSVALFAGIKVTDEAEAVDQRWAGMFQGAILFAARALASLSADLDPGDA